MKRVQFRYLLVLVCIAAVGAYGCGDDSDDGGDSNGSNSTSSNSTSSNGTSNNTGSGAVTSTNPEYEGPDMLADTDYRVNGLELVKPGEPVAGVLNGIVQDGLAMNEFHIIIRLSSFADTTVPTTLTVQGDAGVDNGDGTFSWDPEAGMASVGADVDDKGVFINTEPLPLVNFPINVPGEPTVYLPLRNLSFSGKLRGTDQLVNGSLSGNITKADADSVIVPIGNGIMLSLVLGGDMTLDTDTDGDGTLDAWALEGSLSAEAITFQ